MTYRLPCLLALTALAGGCAAPPGADHDRPPGLSAGYEAAAALHRIDAPATDGAGEPNLTLGDDGRLYLSWIEPAGAGHALRFATWSGDDWSEARTIAEGDDWFVNWADFPSMAVTAEGTLAAHWLAKSATGTYAYDIKLSLSHDGGHNWGPAFSPHDDRTATEHGFVSMVPQADGTFVLLWLDGRETALDARGKPLGSGAMTLRSATIDRDGNVTREVLVDPRVCDCCSTDAALTDAGLLAVFRDRSDDEIRDIWSARLVAGRWSESGPLHDDGWRISACPVNGPALAARNMWVACAWFTAPDQRAQVNLAFSTDGGATFAEPLRVDDGEVAGRVDLELMEDGTAIVSWLERGAIRTRRVRPDGSASNPVTIAAPGESRAGGFPRLALHDGRLFVAWTEPARDDAPSRVRTVWLPAPG